MSYPTEQAHWDAWERGETRCPYCVGLDDVDFEMICDCSRHSLETTGQAIAFTVVGSDNPPVIVKPHLIVRPEVQDQD